MKRVIFILAAIMSFAAIDAQAQKFGHINTDSLLVTMPAYKTAQAALQKAQAESEGQYTKMLTEYQSAAQKFQQESATYSELVRQTELQSIQDMERRIGQFEQQAQQSLMEKQAELLASVEKEAKAAIDAVAAEKGYDYVFNSAVLLKAPAGDNMMKAVKAKLGITN